MPAATQDSLLLNNLLTPAARPAATRASQQAVSTATRPEFKELLTQSRSTVAVEQAAQRRAAEKRRDTPSSQVQGSQNSNRNDTQNSRAQGQSAVDRAAARRRADSLDKPGAARPPATEAATENPAGAVATSEQPIPESAIASAVAGEPAKEAVDGGLLVGSLIAGAEADQSSEPSDSALADDELTDALTDEEAAALAAASLEVMPAPIPPGTTAPVTASTSTEAEAASAVVQTLAAPAARPLAAGLAGQVLDAAPHAQSAAEAEAALQGPLNPAAATSDSEASTLSKGMEAKAFSLPEGVLNKETVVTEGQQAKSLLQDVRLEEGGTKASATAAAAVEALLRPQESHALAPSARSFVAQTSLPQAFGQPQWPQALSERVLWLAAQNLSVADIRLDPPELGSLQVRVSVNQEQASVSFVSPHPQVREALDQQATRLREMFSEQGLNLVNLDVSDRRRESGGERDGSDQSPKGGEGDETLRVLGESAPGELRLVDHYA